MTYREKYWALREQRAAAIAEMSRLERELSRLGNEIADLLESHGDELDAEVPS